MIVVRSKLIGYCHGVSSTINMAQSCLRKAGKANLPCYSIGNLIHNPDTVKEFREKGMKVIEDPSEAKPGIALIRAHGITDELRLRFLDCGFELVDSTCKNIQNTRALILKASKKGRPVIVMAKNDHAEAKCLMGCNDQDGKPIKSILVSSLEDLAKLDEFDCQTPFFIVTQTTFPEVLYCQLSEEILKRFPSAEVGNKLCQACIIRKKKGLELAEKVDVIVVVGGKESENTKNLSNYISTSRKPVFLIENVGDLTSEVLDSLRPYKTVGVCSGTSTPYKVIDEVCNALETLV